MMLSVPMNWVNSYNIIYGRISKNFFWRGIYIRLSKFNL